MKKRSIVVIAAVAAICAPAFAKPHTTSQPVSPAVEQAVKMLLDDGSLRSRKDLYDPGEHPTVPANFRPSKHRKLDGVLIMGGPETLPM